MKAMLPIMKMKATRLLWTKSEEALKKMPLLLVTL